MQGTLLLLLFSCHTKATIVWQGFDYQWRNQLEGFETPHRLGTLQSNIPTQNGSQGSVGVTFTPGVDGDYAFPTVYLGHVNQTLRLLTVDIDFEDSLNETSAAPYASSRRRVAIPGAAQDVFYFLNGFTLESRCDEACAVCNSNGSWIYNMSLDVRDDDKVVELYLSRGWTPSKGGGKPLSTCIRFNLTVDLVAVNVSQNVNVTHQTLSKSQPISDTVFPESRVFQRSDGYAYLLGIGRFSWELINPTFEDRGRYFERVAFFLADAACANVSYCTYSAVYGLESPLLTTYPTNVLSTMDVVILGFEHSIVESKAVNATVCKNDFYFDCEKHGFDPRLSQTVPVSF